MKTTLHQLDKRISHVCKILKKYGASQKIISSIVVRSTKSNRKTTGSFISNRQFRWKLKKSDPQFATERNCKLITMKMLCSIFAFENSPTLLPIEYKILAGYGFPVVEPVCDPLSGEPIQFRHFIKHTSNYHLGHLYPKQTPKHVPENTCWITKSSNTMQGDMSIVEAKQRICEIYCFLRRKMLLVS